MRLVLVGFDSYWLKNWRESFQPITKRSNRNHVITFDSHLKTVTLSEHCFALVRFELSLFMTNQSVKLMCVDVL